MNWAARRKLFYLAIVLLVLTGAIFYFTYPLIIKNPTCFDGKQNGDEKGIDCGGSCQNLCQDQVHPINLLWQRFFKVAPGIYDAVGYLENQNVDAGIPNLLYRFKLYDENNVLLAERDGRTYLGPNQSSVIFEGGINTGELVPKRIFLEFEDGYEWVKTDPRFNKIILSVKDKELSDVSSSPRLSSVIENQSIFDLGNIEISVILRDADNNAVAASKTVLEKLLKKETEKIFFTWLNPFKEPSRVEIIPRVNPFTISY